MIKNLQKHLNEIAIPLCQSAADLIMQKYNDKPQELSENLCGIYGETLKTISVSGSHDCINALGIWDVVQGDSLQSREKFILEEMTNIYLGIKNVEQIITALTQTDDLNFTVPIVRNTSHLLQLMGKFNDSYKLFRYFTERYNSDLATDFGIIMGGRFFEYETILQNRRGLHDLKDIDLFSNKKNISDFSRYHFTVSGSDEILRRNIDMVKTTEYRANLIIECFRRQFEPEFLKFQIRKFPMEKFDYLLDFLFLTHLQWGGPHWSLFRHLLATKETIKNKINDSKFITDQIKLAAHLGEQVFAQQINDYAFENAFGKDFCNDNADDYYLACVSANLFEEANTWLSECDIFDYDLDYILQKAAENLSSVGKDLVDIAYFTNIEKYGLDSSLIGFKWINGFDVKSDIRYLLLSRKTSPVNKIRSLQFI